MTTRAVVDEFLAQKQLAVLRASRKTPVHGFRVDKELQGKGYTVSVVYLEEDGPGTKLSDLKEPVGGVIIAVSSNLAAKAVEQAIEAQIPRIWLQQGSESKAAIQLCEEKGISVIYGECVLMFAEPVKSIHAFHRWIWKLFGKLPH